MYVSAGLGATGGSATPMASLESAGIAAGISILLPVIQRLISGCGPSCVQTSSWANQAEAALRSNINAYFALPVPRSKSDQAAALANFDTLWSHLQAQCSTVSGAAGANCIGDRQAGACKWKQPAGSVPPWGTPAAGECWNWVAGYRDPIANDPNVSADSMSTAAGDVASVLSSLTGGSSWGLAALGIGAAVLFLALKR